MEDYVLYIIMRTDLASMNAGKAIAQGSHIANCAAKQLEITFPDIYEAWAGSTTQHFGTAIVLNGGKVEVIQATIDEAESYAYTSKERFVCGMVNDPTYPVRDGSVTHLVNIPVGAYIFAKRGGKIAGVVKEFGLY